MYVLVCVCVSSDPLCDSKHWCRRRRREPRQVWSVYVRRCLEYEYVCVVCDVMVCVGVL